MATGRKSKYNNMGGMPWLAVTASDGKEKCHLAEKTVTVRKECLVPSPPLLAKAG